MSGVLGELAKWTIEERDRGGLRKVLWKPRENAVSSYPSGGHRLSPAGGGLDTGEMANGG